MQKKVVSQSVNQFNQFVQLFFFAFVYYSEDDLLVEILI